MLKLRNKKKKDTFESHTRSENYPLSIIMSYVQCINQKIPKAGIK